MCKSRVNMYNTNIFECLRSYFDLNTSLGVSKYYPEKILTGYNNRSHFVLSIQLVSNDYN